VIRGIREIRGYDQPVSRSPSSRTFSSAGSSRTAEKRTSWMANGKWKMVNASNQPLFSISHLPFSIQAGIFQRPASAARPAAAAHARPPGGLTEGDRPSRTSGVGGLHESVAHGVTGFLHPPDDPVGMAASGVRLLTDPDLHRSVAAAGQFGPQWC
jgi:hypothetical protein